MSTILIIFICISFLVVCLSSITALAQSLDPAHNTEATITGGYITGYVLDENGNPVRGAIVSLWQDGQLWRHEKYNDYSGLKTPNPQTTGIVYENVEGFVKEGGFTFGLPYPDEYTLSAEKNGHKGSANVHVGRETLNMSDTASRVITVNITLKGTRQPTFSPEQLSYTGAIVGEVWTPHGYRTAGRNVSLWLDGHLVNTPNNPQEIIEQNYSGTSVDYVFDHLAPGRYTVMVPYFAGDYYNETVTIDVGTRPMRADVVLTHALMRPTNYPVFSFTPTVGEFVASPQTSLSVTALLSTISKPTPGLPGIIVVLVIGFMACLLYKKDRSNRRK